MDPDKLIASADVEILDLHAQKWRQTLRLLQNPAGAALRECYASCSKSLIPFLTPTVATPPVSEEACHPLATDELLAEVGPPTAPPALPAAAMNRSRSQLDNSSAGQGDEGHRRSRSAEDHAYYAKNGAESDTGTTEKAESASEEQQQVETSAESAHREQAGAIRGSSGNPLQDAKTDAIQAWEAAIEAQKAGDVPRALERLQYAEKRCPETRVKALRKIRRLISALSFYIFADSVDPSGPDARRQTDEAFQGAISAIDEWKDYISAFWLLQAALKTCPASAQTARNKIMAKLDVCNEKISEET